MVLRRRIAAPGITTALGVTVLLLTGCGAPPAGPGSGPAPAVPEPVTRDDALARMVPTPVAQDGKLVFGTDASYPPNEFYDTDGRTFIGMDIELAKAVAGKLGLTAEFQNSAFGAILLGVQSGKYEAGISSFTINKERTASVDMVSYFNVGTKAAVLRGNPDKIDLENLCGKPVGVQLDTVQVEDLAARSKKCQAEGKPAIAVTALQAQTDVTLALTAKRVAAMLADAPVVNYAITQTNGQLEALGNQYLAAPYGIELKRGQGDYTKAVQGAVQALIDDGTYQKIVDRWHGGESAIKTAEVNPDTGQ